MLTPQFELTQTDDEVTIIIHAPYADIKDTQIEAEGEDFRFFAIPYYLRLKLPGEIEETFTSSGRYECDKGDFILKFSKVNKGEFFPNLDMITTLLLPSKSKHSIGPKIEVIGNPANFDQIDKNLDEDDKKEDDKKEHDKDEDDKKEDDKKEDDKDEDDKKEDDKYEDDKYEDDKYEDDKEASNKWYFPQSIEPDKGELLFMNTPKYGFANKISSVLYSFEPAWIKEVIDLPIPDLILECNRKKHREATESKDFDEDHYMADFVEPGYLESYILFTPVWYKLKKGDIKFNRSEIYILKELPNKEYLLDDKEINLILLSLVDILYGSCYNHRTTFGENTVESGWTINKLSSTLSWFQNFNTMDEVIKACIRRSLCYPLVRNWRLSIEVLEDVKQVVKLGKKYIIKLFCEIYRLFNKSYEPRYLLNQLYIKDYLIWLQSIPDSLIDSLIPSLNNVYPDKESINLGIVELETAINCTIEENDVIENMVHNITNQTQNLDLNNSSTDKEESSSTDSSSSSTDSSSTSSSSSSDSESDYDCTTKDCKCNILDSDDSETE